MKNYQEYDFQRIAAQNRDGQAFNNNSYTSANSNSGDLRISALEQRIDALEKKLLYYEELISMKNCEIEKLQEHSSIINDTLRRVAEVEESMTKFNSLSGYSLLPIDIENIIEGKLNINQILIDTKLNDLSIMMQDLSQYNVNQQKQYSNTQEILSVFNDKIMSNSKQIKDLTNHIKSLQSEFDGNNSDEEELFLHNIQRS